MGGKELTVYYVWSAFDNSCFCEDLIVACKPTQCIVLKRWTLKVFNKPFFLLNVLYVFLVLPKDSVNFFSTKACQEAQFD